VPVHYKTVNLTIYIRTEESDERLSRLIDLVSRFCPVDSLIKAAVPDYHVTWERMPADMLHPAGILGQDKAETSSTGSHG